MTSSALLLASLPEAERTKFLQNLTDEQGARLKWNWRFWARPEQLTPEGSWNVWIILAGRGWGKTRTGAEYVRSLIESGAAERIALVGPTSADCRDVMIEGPSGLLSVCPPWAKPNYEPSKRRLTWSNGATATSYSADEPDRLRGPQHDAAWCDEIAAWRFPECWDQLNFGLRSGSKPRVIITTTPRPTELVRQLVGADNTIVTTGSTYDNSANLAPSFIKRLKDRYEGSRLGRQEIHAEILEDVPGALWQRSNLDEHRVKDAPVLRRIVVAIDPAVTSGEDADETGIIVAGIDADLRGYVLADLTCRESPDGWANRAVRAYHEYNADLVVAETNNGGDLVEAVIRTVDPDVSFKKVHASRGKFTRAEPVAALYEQEKVHHAGSFGQLEDQMCVFTPEGLQKSPDRVDALVWALTELMLGRDFHGKMSLAPDGVGYGVSAFRLV